MAKTPRTSGTGATAVTRTTYSGDDIEPAMRRYFERHNAALSEGGGVFGADTLAAVKGCRALLAEAGDGPIAADSPQDFARRILDCFGRVTAFAARGDSDIALSEAFALGRLVERAEIKFRVEPLWDAGRRMRERFDPAASEHNLQRRRKAEAEHAQWLPQAIEYWNGRPSWSASRLAGWVLKQSWAPALSLDRVRKIVGQAAKPAQ